MTPTPPNPQLSDELEKLLPRCKTKDTADFPELHWDDDPESRCYNCRLWEAIEAYAAQRELAGRIVELEDVRAYTDSRTNLDLIAHIEHRLAQLKKNQEEAYE